MSVQAKKRTNSQKRRRGSHMALAKKSLSVCPKCKKPTLPHHACTFCGYYKSKDVLYLEVKEDRKKKKAKKKEDKAKGK